jgi:hypothetical protein
MQQMVGQAFALSALHVLISDGKLLKARSGKQRDREHWAENSQVEHLPA